LQIKKHIPNILTLANLLCGCLALVQIIQFKSINYACFLIFISLVCDYLDGFLARKLDAKSPIGGDLDSLADMVTFGVVPAFIACYLLEYHAGITSHLKYSPLIIALFSALRLAKFNIDTRQTDSFIGLNTPANTIMIGSIALNLVNSKGDFISSLFTNYLVIIVFSIISSLLLVAEIPMFAFKFKHFKIKGNEIRFGFLAFAVLLLLTFKTVAIPWIIISYIVLSIINNFTQKPKSIVE
jgi:CDP-diacylglycerol---serine O-phosphatidyltransferase